MATRRRPRFTARKNPIRTLMRHTVATRRMRNGSYAQATPSEPCAITGCYRAVNNLGARGDYDAGPRPPGAASPVNASR